MWGTWMYGHITVKFLYTINVHKEIKLSTKEARFLKRLAPLK
jgi:hypothetical protein